MKSVLCSLLCVLALSAAQADETKSLVKPLSKSEIDTLVQRSMATFHVPGIAVAVIKDDKVVYSNGFGVRSLNAKQKVDEHTLFGIASNSKAFTSAALGILVDQKKIKWDDKVTDYIPEFKMYNPYVTDEFTIRDLLTHRSGLGLGAGDLMLWPEGSDFTRADVIHNLRFLKPTSSFRSKYDYDNNLYIIAGEIVARVSGLSWEDFIAQHIFQPIGMTESAPSFFRLKDKSNIVAPHVEFDGKLQAVDAQLTEVSDAAGGINSNLVDLSKWVRLQLNSGAYGKDLSQHLFSAEVQQEMWSPQTITPFDHKFNPYNTHFAAYGLGWGLRDVNGYKQVGHTGGLTGVVTQVTLIPELKLGIIVLTNQQVGAAFSSITDTIKDAYFGLPKVDRIAQYHARLEEKNDEDAKAVAAVWAKVDAQKNAVNSIAPVSLVGTYRDNWFGDVVLSYQDGKLLFTSAHSPKLKGEMFYYQGTTYAVKWFERSMLADAFATFLFGVDGKPTGIKMAVISEMTDFSYDFQDLDLKLVK
ncbi:serine hydrolase [Sapientia aquatica]|uniref:Serine hydrolase n=1 Tax=Sapientia aquatica TaxID=1549640 RepID=A0A4R5W0Y7_9BURK|nr:serine hydrolase [Sapientia aquatica]TDK65602.1 serine hydrolase [Sapientia aquatica]